MNTTKNFVIDFDSTFTQVEALEVLAEISLRNHPQKEEILLKIKQITDQGMEGDISFRDSLIHRLELLEASRSHLNQLIEELRNKVSRSFVRNKQFFDEFSDSIYIVSNGFKEFICPIVKEYGIKEENVYANTFIFDSMDNITGFDQDNVLSSDNGKVALLNSLNLSGDIYVIGDGYTDYEVKKAGLANKFYAFTENVERSKVRDVADHVAPSLDEFLYHNKLPASISYPKNRINVLLLENVHPMAEKLLREEGYNVEVYPAGLDEDELCEKIKNVSILGIRSKTQVTQKVIDHANRLMAIGAFCIGTNQIDLQACLKKGIVVFNAPFSNTRSVVELAIGEIILLMRNLPDKIAGMHLGKWDKSAKNSHEVRGKKLGIIGYGNIGAQLSILAEAMGMEVYYYDITEKLALGNARKTDSLDELLQISDIISLHVDGRPDNKNMIGDREFHLMKDGVIFVNLSRGHVVDIDSMRVHIQSGKIRGAAIDVFPYEPKSNNEPFESPLVGMPNTILTPHVGGSTSEAQENIARFVPARIMEYINTGSTTNSVNFPEIQLPPMKNAHRMMHIHHNVPGVLAAINQVIAKHNLNIIGQYLKTNESIGYMILAVDKEYDNEVINELKNVEHTIRFRVLY
ncbi:MAG: phosphoglycerate dehydrogenase [Cyclobacteriaceae bacterium]|nr:phosphoglycerate dehydrogenase [Cyclobacteriaceae bacterium]